MNSRDTIFRRIQSAVGSLPQKAPLPDIDIPGLSTSLSCPQTSDTEPLIQSFVREWETNSGKLISQREKIADFLSEHQVKKGFVDPRCSELLGVSLDQFETHDRFDRDQVDSYEFGITLVSGAIAETGTLILRDRDSRFRLGALAPWIHVGIVRRDDLLRSVSDAIKTFDDDPSIIFVTGPSKTADIEGVLLEGVHGPGIQACCLV